MLKHKINIFWLLLIVPTALGIGYLFAKGVGVTFFVLTYEVSLIDLLSLGATVFVAIYLTNILDKHKEQSKNEKQIVFTHLERIDEMARDVANKTASGAFERKEAEGSFKKIGTALTAIKRTLGLVKLPYESEIDKLLTLHLEIRDLSTFLPRTPPQGLQLVGPGFPDIRFDAGSFKYSDQRMVEIDQKLTEFSHDLTKLQIYINKH